MHTRWSLFLISSLSKLFSSPCCCQWRRIRAKLEPSDGPRQRRTERGTPRVLSVEMRHRGEKQIQVTQIGARWTFLSVSQDVKVQDRTSAPLPSPCPPAPDLLGLQLWHLSPSLSVSLEVQQDDSGVRGSGGYSDPCQHRHRDPGAQHEPQQSHRPHPGHVLQGRPLKSTEDKLWS